MSDRVEAIAAWLERWEGGLDKLKLDIILKIKRMFGKNVFEESPHQEEEGDPSAGSNFASKESTQPRVVSHNGWDEFRLLAKKVELPTFDGTDPVAWIARAVTYFEVQ